MADPISLGSGLLTLVVFALQSSKTLYETFESFRNHGRTIRELKEELMALNEVLHSLKETVKQNESSLSALKLPLLSCGNACKEFATVVAKCTTHSDGLRTSLRDWARVSYMGKDIAGFRSLMGGYKSTITIALGDANIRTAVVTANLLKEYRDMIKSTAADLEELLEGVNDKINSHSTQEPKNPASNDPEDEENSMEEERASIQQCLKICAEVSAHIEQVLAEDLASTPSLLDLRQPSIKLGGTTPARLTISTTLDNCKRGLGITSSQLKMQLDDINSRMAKLAEHGSVARESATQDQSQREELESIKQCLSICTNAVEQLSKERVNVFEDVESADDGHQVIVATMGDLISAKRVTVGARSAQWMGQMSDTSLQQLSKDRTESVAVINQGTKTGVHFEGRHGAGRQLI